MSTASGKITKLLTASKGGKGGRRKSTDTDPLWPPRPGVHFGLTYAEGMEFKFLTREELLKVFFWRINSADTPGGFQRPVQGNKIRDFSVFIHEHEERCGGIVAQPPILAEMMVPPTDEVRRTNVEGQHTIISVLQSGAAGCWVGIVRGLKPKDARSIAIRAFVAMNTRKTDVGAAHVISVSEAAVARGMRSLAVKYCASEYQVAQLARGLVGGSGSTYSFNRMLTRFHSDEQVRTVLVQMGDILSAWTGDPRWIRQAASIHWKRSTRETAEPILLNIEKTVATCYSQGHVMRAIGTFINSATNEAWIDPEDVTSAIKLIQKWGAAFSRPVRRNGQGAGKIIRLLMNHSGGQRVVGAIADSFKEYVRSEMLKATRKGRATHAPGKTG